MNALRVLLLLPLLTALGGCDYITRKFLHNELAAFEAQMQAQYQNRIQGLEADKVALEQQITQLKQQITQLEQQVVDAKEKRIAAESREEERLRKFLLMYGVDTRQGHGAEPESEKSPD